MRNFQLLGGFFCPSFDASTNRGIYCHFRCCPTSLCLQSSGHKKADFVFVCSIAAMDFFVISFSVVILPLIKIYVETELILSEPSSEITAENNEKFVVSSGIRTRIFGFLATNPSWLDSSIGRAAV